MEPALRPSPVPESLQAFLRGDIRSLSRTEADLLYAIGSAFYDREELSMAVDVFRLLVLGQPDDARSWASLAIAHDAVGDTDVAIPLYELACVAPHANGWRDRAHLYLARSLWSEGRCDEARALLDAVDSAELPEELETLHRELEIELARRHS